MGGIGSGWFERRSNKMRTDDCPSIDVRQLGCNSRRDGYVALAGGAMVILEWRQCHFGGHRPYFQCPCCMGLCCLLYRDEQGIKDTPRYGCQKCLGMVHPVENEGKLERAVIRSNKAFKRQCYDAMRPEGKPLWMRWNTWRRISEKVKASISARFDYHEKMVTLLATLENSPTRKKSTSLDK